MKSERQHRRDKAAFHAALFFLGYACSGPDIANPVVSMVLPPKLRIIAALFREALKAFS
jgi:hypothetical protein